MKIDFLFYVLNKKLPYSMNYANSNIDDEKQHKRYRKLMSLLTERVGLPGKRPVCGICSLEETKRTKIWS